jgi:hypothetical protein
MEYVAVGDIFTSISLGKVHESNFFKFVSLKNYFAKKQQHWYRKSSRFLGGDLKPAEGENG